MYACPVLSMNSSSKSKGIKGKPANGVNHGANEMQLSLSKQFCSPHGQAEINFV